MKILQWLILRCPCSSSWHIWRSLDLEFARIIMSVQPHVWYPHPGWYQPTNASGHRLLPTFVFSIFYFSHNIYGMASLFSSKYICNNPTIGTICTSSGRPISCVILVRLPVCQKFPCFSICYHFPQTNRQKGEMWSHLGATARLWLWPSGLISTGIDQYWIFAPAGS